MTIEELKEEKKKLEEKIRAAFTEFCISTMCEVRGQFFAEPYVYLNEHGEVEKITSAPNVTINQIEKTLGRR